jgi:hypothetical protein
VKSWAKSAACSPVLAIPSYWQTMPRYFGEFLGARGSSRGVFLVKQSAPVGEIPL